MAALLTVQEGLRIAVGYQVTKILTELAEQNPTVNQVFAQVLGAISPQAAEFTPANTPEIGSAVAASQVAWLRKVPFIKGVPGLKDYARGGFAWGVGRFVISILTRFGVGFPAPLRPQF